MAGSAPRKVREFVIGPRLGSGTQGRVYKAISETTGEEVALKVTDQVKLVSSNPAGSPIKPVPSHPWGFACVSINLQSGDRSYRNFQREIEALRATTDHPHAVTVKDVRGSGEWALGSALDEQSM